MVCCVVCGLFYVMCAVVEYPGSCIVCGLLYFMWAVVGYAGCCRVSGLLYGMLLFIVLGHLNVICAVVGYVVCECYVGYFTACGQFYVIKAFVWFVGCCRRFGL